VGFLVRDVDVPRTLLIEAALEVVDRTLSTGSPAATLGD
jgi:hypothetical protein